MAGTHLWEELWHGRGHTTPCSLEWQLVMSHKWVSHLWAGGSTSPIDTVATNMLSAFLIPFGSKSIQFLRSLSTDAERNAFMFQGLVFLFVFVGVNFKLLNKRGRSLAARPWPKQ